MATIDRIIQHYNVIKEAGRTHRRHFKNMKSTGYEIWPHREKLAF